MYIVHTSTEALITIEEIKNMYPEPSIGFSVEGLADLPFIILDDPTPLPYDPVFYTQSVVLSKVEGVFSVSYQNTPSINDIDLALATKELELNRDCQVNITLNRFLSMAVGEERHYGADGFDQSSIQGNVLFAIAAPEPIPHFCYTAGGTKVLEIHTPEQMIQVGKDLRMHVMTNVIRCNQLKQQAKAYAEVNNYNALAGIRW